MLLINFVEMASGYLWTEICQCYLSNYLLDYILRNQVTSVTQNVIINSSIIYKFIEVTPNTFKELKTSKFIY